MNSLEQAFWWHSHPAGFADRLYSKTQASCESVAMSYAVVSVWGPTRKHSDLRYSFCFLQATEEKHRLERKEKDEVALAAKAGEPLQPRWFRKRPGNPVLGEDFLFEYAGGYWESRMCGNYGQLRCPF